MADAPTSNGDRFVTRSSEQDCSRGKRHKGAPTAERRPPSDAAKMSPIEQIWTLVLTILWE